MGRVLISDLVAFNCKIIDLATEMKIGEIDAKTSKLVVEVTADRDGKLGQVLKEKHDKLINPQ